jgi:hypothetical protein
VSRKQETSRPARRVADPVINIGINKIDYHPDYVPRRPELPVRYTVFAANFWKRRFILILCVPIFLYVQAA